MAGCPTEEELAGFVGGACSDAEGARTRAHLGECARCARWVTAARSNDAALANIQHALAPIGGSGRQGSGQSSRHNGAVARPAIEGYEVGEEIGRGGMGVVYKAIQLSTKRNVALKVLIEGPFASTTAKRRFEREVELAAQLQHPHIVTILESGIASGRYYCAMQYIDGQRLDRYMAHNRPTLEATLLLFAKICDAVSYAHQRGVIHRDLKPSNILVDKDGHPHMLDFGLAKVADTTDLERTQLSLTGQVMGTLPYMSPEQARGSSQDIDIRTDVYSLGVILYEMLTGRFPYPVAGTLADVLRNIAEAEPQRPSTWNRTFWRAPAADGSASRHRVGDELETIVLKALAKSRERRYESVSNLLKDIERYLAGEPVEAKRDSAWYVIRKLAVRNAYATALLVAVAFIFLASVLLILDSQHQGRLAKAEAQFQKKTQELQVETGEQAAEAVRRMALGWFLADWRAGHIERATQIRDAVREDSPERLAMTFLLDGAFTEERLLHDVPASATALAQFVIGERHLSGGRPVEALQAFEASIAAGGGEWLDAESQVRLAQLRPRVGRADRSTDSE